MHALAAHVYGLVLMTLVFGLWVPVLEFCLVEKVSFVLLFLRARHCERRRRLLPRSNLDRKKARMYKERERETKVSACTKGKSALALAYPLLQHSPLQHSATL